MFCFYSLKIWPRCNRWFYWMVEKNNIFLSRTYRSISLQCGMCKQPIVWRIIHFNVFVWKIFFVIFLGLFSFVLLNDFLPLNIYYRRSSKANNHSLPIAEIVLHICLWSLIIEELRQVRKIILKNINLVYFLVYDDEALRIFF